MPHRCGTATHQKPLDSRCQVVTTAESAAVSGDALKTRNLAPEQALGICRHGVSDFPLC